MKKRFDEMLVYKIKKGKESINERNEKIDKIKE